MKQMLGPSSLLAFALVACGEDAGTRAEPSDASIDAALDGGLVDALTPLESSTADASDGSQSAPDGSVSPPCATSASADQDDDGFPGSQDCHDCDPNINPGAFDISGNGVDEDCSGTADDEPTDCDVSLPQAAHDARDAARALGLCRTQSGVSWGLVGARWMFPDGSERSINNPYCPSNLPPHPLSRSILSRYGDHNAPTQGTSMLAMSSGVARAGAMELGAEALPASGRSPDAADMCGTSRPPAGFPKSSSGCPALPAGADVIYDGVALELTLRVPTNAHALAYDFDFFTSEFPNFVCEGKNDHFVALLDSSHPATPADGNITFDKQGNVITVDSAFLQVCRAVTYKGRTFACPRGPTELAGTALDVEMVGVDDMKYLRGGATGWLSTSAPVQPGETITLRLAIWDSDDSTADSLVLVDNFRWSLRESAAPPPVAQPVTDVVLY